MLETPYARKLLLLLTHGPGPAWAGKLPIGTSKNLAPGAGARRQRLGPTFAPSFCLGQGAFFLRHVFAWAKEAFLLPRLA